MLTNGIKLEGYKLEGAPEGLDIVKACPADLPFFWAYSVAYRTTSDEFIWGMVRSIAQGNHFGDIGQMPLHSPDLRTETSCSHVYGLLGFLQLHEKTKNRAFLEMAQQIADNVIQKQFHLSFFVPSKDHIYARFDTFEPLALLHLHAALQSKTETIPQVWPNVPLFVCPYRHKLEGIDQRDIYTLTESTEPPLSLQEAAAMGDVDLVFSLLNKGIGVDTWDDSTKRTALQQAAVKGHREVAELLLSKGAKIEAKEDWPGGTPLDYAAENGRKEVVELLITKGADLNAKRGYPAGDTPLHSTVRTGHRSVVELLISKGADVNAKNTDGQTPLHLAAKQQKKEIYDVLVAAGADVNIKNNRGRTPQDIEKGQSGFLIAFIGMLALPVMTGIVFAIPLTMNFRKLVGQPKRFWRYFGLFIVICLVEYLAIIAGIVLSSGAVSAIVFVFFPTCAWGIAFGLWLRGCSPIRKVLKTSVFISLYSSLPFICLITVLLVVEIIDGANIISSEEMKGLPFQAFPWPLNTMLGLYVALVLGAVLLKTAIITGEIGLLIGHNKRRPHPAESAV
jgi:hypothetical protein